MKDLSNTAAVTACVADPLSDFCTQVQNAIADGGLDTIPDQVMQELFAAVVRLYAAKVEARDAGIMPFGTHDVSVTASVVAICAMMRSADLNFFDLQMWYRRSDPA